MNQDQINDLVKKAVDSAEKTIAFYVTNMVDHPDMPWWRKGSLQGKIKWHNGGFVVAAYLGNGDMHNDDNFIVCRKFKTLEKAKSAASEILNCGESVGIAALL